ncbi:helix-turn-helix transcriptional regulator [Granulosicoccaceae sp. 1_MG-2023]|nr:helix-turn-helix transcriptional regulator [Granulosicoccaceae sp. 1_MG-2023]
MNTIDNESGTESGQFEDSSGFAERLREAMRGRSIREFASTAGMSAGTLHNYLNNESLPTLDKLIALSNTANVSLNWLATGRGPVERIDDNEDEKSLNIALLCAVLECLEHTLDEFQISMSAEKKSGVVASMYDLYSELDEQAVNKEKITRLIRTTVG